MKTPKRIQLEISGFCPGRCATCLPVGYKTNARISLGAIGKLSRDWKAFGIEAITLAGFGSATAHPQFYPILRTLKEAGFRTCVVCRANELPLCDTADTVIVSVQGEAERLELERRMLALPPGVTVSTNTVVAEKHALLGMDWLHTLASNPRIARVNVADALRLCDEDAHVEAIRAIAKVRKEVLWLVESARRKLPDHLRHKVTQQIEGHFPEKCAFHDDLIYVDAHLGVAPCCHHPVDLTLAQLDPGEPLEKSLAAGNYYPWVKLWRAWPGCQKCPDVGQ